jgi:hypothetical protein
MTTYIITLGAVAAVVLVAVVAFRPQLKRAMRLGKALATDRRLPRYLRVMLAFGLLPIPGPIDDGVLVIAGLIVLVRHRSTFRAIVIETRAP